MSKPAIQTKFTGNISPFTGKSTKQSVLVDTTTLKIVDDAYKPERARMAGKYDPIFSTMKFGQAVKCDPKEASKIATAMKKWAEKTKTKIVVRATSSYHEDGQGRVWMLRG